MDGQEIQPSRWYYALAVLVFVAGVAAFAGLLFKTLSALDEGVERVVVPGQADLTLSKVGNYTISYEYRSVVGSKVYATEKDLPGLDCALVSKRTGAKLSLSRASMSSSYQMGGREGYAVLEFRIDQPGTYAFSARYGEGKEGPEVVLAIGPDTTGRLLGTIFGSLAIFFGSLILGLAIFLVTLIKRQKAKKLLQVPASPYRPIE